VLPRANTIDAITFNGAAIAGPAVAGSIAAAASPDAAVWVTAGIALAAVPATLMLRMPPHHGQPAATSLWATIVAGTRVMLHTPPLRGGTLTTAVMQGALGMLAVGFPLYAVQLGSSEEAGGALWAALEIGGLVGALTATRLLAWVSPERLIYALTALVGVAIVTWPLAGSITSAAVLVFLAGLLSGPVLVATFSMRQRYSPHNLLAQITTAGASMKIGAFSLGAAAGGWLVPAAGVLPALALVGGLHLAGAAAGHLAGRPPAVRFEPVEVGKSAPRAG
jgi:hypothetical protein